MKWIYIIFSFAIIAKCKVVHSDNDTRTWVEGGGNFDDEISEENEDLSENFDLDRSEDMSKKLVFLNNFFIAIDKQNWTDDEQPCLDQVRRMLHGLQNFTLWAVWDWEAQTHELPSVIFGTKYQLGNFDQCLSAPWVDKHPELRTKYCIVDVHFKRNGKVNNTKPYDPLDPYQSATDFIENRPAKTRALNELKWGACVPSSCQTKSIEKLMAIMFNESHLGTAGFKVDIETTEECQTYERQTEGDSLFYGFLGFVAALVTIAILCTCLNQSITLDPDLFSTGLIRAFCLKENARNLLNVKKEGVEVLYGIRFLSICLVVFNHQIGIYNSGPLSDGYTTDQIQVTFTFLGMFILHIDLVVDTFFFLSGFLTVTYLVKIKRLPNPIIIILVRYIRLVTALSVVVFFYAAAFPYTVSGPLWVKAVEFDTAPCKKNWWLNLVMLQNYIDSENICMISSWYIPCDFHAFVVTVLIYYLYTKLPSLGAICAVLVTIASIITPGLINYFNNFDAVQLFTYKFVDDPRVDEHFNAMYIKSHVRYASYLVGFIAGYIFCSCRSQDKQDTISKKWAIIGSIVALLLMLFVMIYGSTFIWREYDPIEGAVYAALDRPVWAIAVGLLVLCCSLGSVPLIKGFLSWKAWVPLSRMAFGIYLTHTGFITRNVYSVRNPEHNGYFFTLVTTTGVIFWSGLAALALWLLVEAPANRLLALCLRSQIQKFNDKQEESSSYEVATIPANDDHYKYNIRFSSKM